MKAMQIPFHHNALALGFRTVMIVACAWNCVLPVPLHACCCTGTLLCKPAEKSCGCCQPTSQAESATCAAGASCCHHDATQTSKSTTQPCSTTGRCSSDCCVKLLPGKVPAVLSASFPQDQIASSALLVTDSIDVAPSVTTDWLVEANHSPPPPTRILLGVWRN